VTDQVSDPYSTTSKITDNFLVRIYNV
jgi:hypothetical protein